jgi:hypothetical protein
MILISFTKLTLMFGFKYNSHSNISSYFNFNVVGYFNPNINFNISDAHMNVDYLNVVKNFIFRYLMN